MKQPEKIDIDFFLKIYTYASFRNAGVYRNVTYNGNVTLAELPIATAEDTNKVFSETLSSAKHGQPNQLTGSTCAEAIASFLAIMGQ